MCRTSTTRSNCPASRAVTNFVTVRGVEQRTVNISLPPQLILAVDELADREGRSRSELMREALRQYMVRGERWVQIFAYGEEAARRAGVTEPDIADIVEQHRRARR